jgi:hypothetical protein
VGFDPHLTTYLLELLAPQEPEYHVELPVR